MTFVNEQSSIRYGFSESSVRSDPDVPGRYETYYAASANLHYP